MWKVRIEMSLQPRCTCDFTKPLPGTDCPRHAKLRKWLDEEWLPEQERARAEMAKTDHQWDICHLVELFEPTGNSMGYYHTGFTDIDGRSRTTRNPHEAKRYASFLDAARVAGSLHHLAGVWRAVEHGFAR